MTHPMTTAEAIALITGTGSLTDPRRGCLGAGDLAAVLTIIAEAKLSAKTSGRSAPVKGRLYRVASVCESVHYVVARDEADAYDRMMCGEGTLIESDTHDTSITRLRK
jgi:hypothetical protein